MDREEALLANFQVRPILIDHVLEAQAEDEESQELTEVVSRGKKKDLRIQESDGMLIQGSRIYMSNITELKKDILDEAHISAYAMDARSTKIYHTIGLFYYWSGMKREIVEYVKVSERALVGLEIVDETTQNIQVIKVNMKEAQDRQKSLDDRHATDRVYNVGDWVFFKLSPWKGVLRFGKKGKLSPRYIGPYQITERVDEVVYRLELPPELAKVHDVFHVSMLCHYVSDPSHVLPPQPLEINPDLTYDEEPVTILDWKDKVLRNKTARLVKVLWRNHSVDEAIWETNDCMRDMYPRLFYGY
ncbi:uncharacterized protein [Pyrus communis]|uniref:uncharacterized protein n=1 Tax=Pyrus communis TaxID=23211 RepID=UPI0035BFD992